MSLLCKLDISDEWLRDASTGISKVDAGIITPGAFCLNVRGPFNSARVCLGLVLEGFNSEDPEDSPQGDCNEELISKLQLC